ncbi:MAG: cupin domain-containing protein [Methylococcales bacterium]
MTKINTQQILMVAAVLFFCYGPVNAVAAEPAAASRTLLMENQVQLSSNSINAKVMRVIFPPAFKTPLHTHDGPGPRYVVKGKLKVVETDKTSTYGAGDVFWEAGDFMTVENIGPEPAEIILFELAPPAFDKTDK